MATFIEINTTDKAGFVHVKLNQLASVFSRKEYYRRISDYVELGIAHDESFVEIRISNNSSLFCSFDTTQSNYGIVETVNGVAPTSNADLFSKLNALLV